MEKTKDEGGFLCVNCARDDTPCLGLPCLFAKCEHGHPEGFCDRCVSDQRNEPEVVACDEWFCKCHPIHTGVRVVRKREWERERERLGKTQAYDIEKYHNLLELCDKAHADLAALREKCDTEYNLRNNLAEQYGRSENDLNALREKYEVALRLRTDEMAALNALRERVRGLDRWALRQVDSSDGETIYDGMETCQEGDWVRHDDLFAALEGE
jgi:hypothetical protein